MSITTKIIIAIIIIILVAVAVWYITTSNSPGSQATQTVSQSSASAPVAESGLTTSPTDSSNAALVQDMGSIDTQMQGLNSDSATVDQSLQTNSQ